jgi:hypothetical protein
MVASDAFSRSNPGPVGAAGGWSATTSAMARPISASSIFSSYRATVSWSSSRARTRLS